MNKKNKKGNIYFDKEPYKIEETDSIDVQIMRYLNDEKKTINIDNRQYYKIISLQFIVIGKARMIAMLDYSLNLRIGDDLMDENGRRYNVIGFPMINFGGKPPMWYAKVYSVELEGDEKDIGEYVTKL